MKNDQAPILSGSTSAGMVRVLAIFFLACSWSAQATAPRIAPQLFGEEKRADIVGYQLAPLQAAGKPDGELVLEIVTEAFKTAGKTPVVDVLPSKQLAKYALLNHDAVALIGRIQDLTAQEKNRYRVVTFYLRDVVRGEEPVVLIFDKKSARGNELQSAFNEGLQKTINSGKYLKVLEKYHGKGQLHADYVSRLKRSNPGWK